MVKSSNLIIDQSLLSEKKSGFENFECTHSIHNFYSHVL